MSKGGFRPGAGAKKNQHRVHVGELRKAMEDTLGIPYVQLLAETQQKLFNDFKNDKNVKEFVTFTENMSKRLLVNPDNDNTLETLETLSKEEIKARIDNYMTRVALSRSADSTEQDSTKNGESTNE